MTAVAEPTQAPEPTRRDDRDPLGRVLALGGGAAVTGGLFGIAGALALHVALGLRAFTALFELGDFAAHAHAFVTAARLNEVDIDTSLPVEPDEPEPEPPPPEPDPAPRLRPTVQAPAEAPAPAAAQAGQALTAEPSPDDPLDFTNTIVTGPGTSYSGGTTASTGTSKSAVHDPRARGGLPPGGTGTGKAPAPPPPAPGKSLARSPTPETLNWRCGFPAEADMEQIDYATVMLSVTVGPDGRAKSVSVLKDPGSGFGNLAKSCAFRMRYSVGLDARGQAVTKTTPPFPVRFTR
jgi:outer membrane biosynthesis protein TonB